MSRIALLCLLLLALPALAEDANLAAAIASLDKGEYAKVVEHAAKVPESSPDKAKALYVSGEAQLLLGQADKAQASFEAARKLRPEVLPITVGLAKAMLARKKHKEAAELLEPLMTKKHRKEAELYRVYGMALAGSGDRRKAVTFLQRSFALDRSDPITAQALVANLCYGDEVKQATAIAQAFLRKNPKNAMSYFLVGICTEARGQYDDAITWYQKAVALDVKLLDAHKNLAILCHQRNTAYRDQKLTTLAFKHYDLYFEHGGKDPKLKKMYEQFKVAAARLGIKR